MSSLITHIDKRFSLYRWALPLFFIETVFYVELTTWYMITEIRTSTRCDKSTLTRSSCTFLCAVCGRYFSNIFKYVYTLFNEYLNIPIKNVKILKVCYLYWTVINGRSINLDILNYSINQNNFHPSLERKRNRKCASL